MHDVVIRGGNIVDGTGKPAFSGDLAIADGRVAAVGKDLGSAKKTVDADGLLITPAWVDAHTHYDGQVTWDEQITPSLWHGVSTVVMGNCGVGFAPATPDRHDWLIGLIEGVEDIPGPALKAGLPWGWQSFAEYLDVLDKLPRTLDVGGMITHGAVRAFVMGERGAKNEPATEKDIAQMAAIVKEAVLAGALGFSTSRTLAHTANDGEPVPGTFATPEELSGIAHAVHSTGRGILEVVPRGAGGENAELVQEVEMFIQIARLTGCPFTFPLVQTNTYPDQWREVMAMCTAAVAGGVPIVPMVFARPVCVLFSFQGENPFEYLPSFQPLKKLSHEEKMAALHNPELRHKLVTEKDPHTTGMSLLYQNEKVWERTYPMGRALSYEPESTNSIAAIAAREKRDPREVVYDLMLEQNGRAFLMYAAFGYADGNADCLYELIVTPLPSSVAAMRVLMCGRS
jgi:N-acyl-D-amino-acid deacylase